MLYTIPDYYREFRCLAEACQDTCCAGWEIVVDKKSLRKYRSVKGSFRKRMVRSVNWLRGTFRQSKNGRCTFLNDDNLCDLYTALGRNSLCRTCRRYPRHIEEFEGVREISLSISCPEAARILLEKREATTFLSVEKGGEEEFADFDPFLYSELADLREVIIRILQDRSLETEVRMMLMLGLSHDMQGRVDRRELFSCGALFERYQSGAALRFVRSKLAIEREDIEESWQKAVEAYAGLYQLELLREDWNQGLKESEELLYWRGPGAYALLRDEFTEWVRTGGSAWEVQKEQLLVYFVFTYFCGAVYDGRVYAKALFAAGNVFLIEELLIARWIRNDRQLDLEDIVDIVYRYSREVEHSDKNLLKMEELLAAGRLGNIMGK